MFKPLFDQYCIGNDDAAELNTSFYKSVQPIFQEYVNAGFSPRDIAQIMHGVVSMVESATILRMQRLAREEKRE